jgi:CBS domain-containing protein
VKQGKDIMIADVVCCKPEHTVVEAAEMMARHDCGEIAIVECSTTGNCDSHRASAPRVARAQKAA